MYTLGLLNKKILFIYDNYNIPDIDYINFKILNNNYFINNKYTIVNIINKLKKNNRIKRINKIFKNNKLSLVVFLDFIENISNFIFFKKLKLLKLALITNSNLLNKFDYSILIYKYSEVIIYSFLNLVFNIYYKGILEMRKKLTINLVKRYKTLI